MEIRLLVFVVSGFNILIAEKVTIPEGQSRSLRCNNNEVINIESAFYTGTSSLLCPRQDVTPKVKALCHLMPFCKVKATDKIFEDSCLFFKERLQIQYTCTEISTSTVTTTTTDNLNKTSSADITKVVANATNAVRDMLSSNQKDSNLGSIIGIVIGCLMGIVVLVLLIVAFVIFRSKHRQKGDTAEREHLEIIQTNFVPDTLSYSTRMNDNHATLLRDHENTSDSNTACRTDITDPKLTVNNVYSIPDNFDMPPPSYELARENSFPIIVNQKAVTSKEPMKTTYSSNNAILSIQNVGYDLPSTHNAYIVGYDSPSSLALGNAPVQGQSAIGNQCVGGQSTYDAPVRQGLCSTGNTNGATDINVYVNQDYKKLHEKGLTNERDNKSDPNLRKSNQYDNIEYRNKTTTGGYINVDTTDVRGQSQVYVPMGFSMKSDITTNKEEDMYVPIMSPALVNTHT